MPPTTSLSSPVASNGSPEVIGFDMAPPAPNLEDVPVLVSPIILCITSFYFESMCGFAPNPPMSFLCSFSFFCYKNLL